ncbi:MAG: HPr kinase/phosphatase C-terminal domain-containing protein [Hyphomicrobiales bacterium]|nr:HPr kinase/phosphatase C-terminal domain-containing protein [Hyphomicrobiales bacterium]
MSDTDTRQLHATCVAIDGHGVMLIGPPGSGKSDLALRLIDDPGCGLGDQQMKSMLVGDDQIVLARRSDTLIASPAAALAGLIEIRGIGILKCPHLAEAPLALVVKLMPQSSIERLPEAPGGDFEELGVSVAVIEVDASQPSAPARVRSGLQAVLSGTLDSHC